MQPKINGIGSKVNQFIYILVCNYMPNIRILAKAVLQIFCSQGCSYTKCLCPKKGSNSTKHLQNRFKSVLIQNACVRKRGVIQPNIYRIGSKVNYFINTLVCNYMPNIRILAKAVLKLFCSQVVPIQNAYVRKRGITPPKIYRIDLKVNQFIYILVCNYMPNIRILAKAVLKIFCSQDRSYTKCLCLKKGNNSTENLWNRVKSLSVHLHLSLYLYAKYLDSSFSGSSDILFTRFFIHS